MLRTTLTTVAAAALAFVSNAQVVVFGDRIHTVTDGVIENGYVLIEDGTIAAVGAATGFRVPEGYEVLRAAVVTPGLIDARTTAGLTGIYNGDGQAHDQDMLETSEPIQPRIRAVDAYNPREELVAYIRSYGVTTIHTGHAPGELISGQTMIVKTAGATIEDAVIEPFFGVAATLDPSAQNSGGKSPGTRGKMYQMLRDTLIDAQEYRDKLERHEEEADGEDAGPAPARDISMDAMVTVLEGDAPLLITANTSQDIASALRLKEEFDIDVWLDMAAECYMLIDEIKETETPVILHPTMYRASGNMKNLSFTTAGVLADEGVAFAMQSGYEGYVPKVRVVLFEAAMAAANGLGPERALEALTINAAELLGIDDRVGSIEVGKDGDLALYDGDPFEYITRCVGVIIEGEIVSDEPR